MLATVIGLLGKAMAKPVRTIRFVCSKPTNTGKKGSLFNSPDTKAS